VVRTISTEQSHPGVAGLALGRLEQRENVLAGVDRPLDVLWRAQSLAAEADLGHGLVGADDVPPGSECVRELDRVANGDRCGVRAICPDDNRTDHGTQS